MFLVPGLFSVRGEYRVTARRVPGGLPGLSGLDIQLTSNRAGQDNRLSFR
jgi:hypothetical protein